MSLSKDWYLIRIQISDLVEGLLFGTGSKSQPHSLASTMSNRFEEIPNEDNIRKDSPRNIVAGEGGAPKPGIYPLRHIQQRGSHF